MTVERVFRCDGPDCHTHQVTRYAFPGQMLVVTERGDHGDLTEHHFCTWDCLLNFAGRIEPAQVIEVG